MHMFKSILVAMTTTCFLHIPCQALAKHWRPDKTDDSHTHTCKDRRSEEEEEAESTTFRFSYTVQVL